MVAAVGYYTYPLTPKWRHSVQRPGTFLCYEHAKQDVNARQRKTKERREGLDLDLQDTYTRCIQRLYNVESGAHGESKYCWSRSISNIPLCVEVIGDSSIFGSPVDMGLKGSKLLYGRSIVCS